MKVKNPLHYQLSEYDCGPTALLDALCYLFPREEIPPDLIRNIMLYSLDCYGPAAVPGKNGTSRMAMMFLSNWLQGFGEAGGLAVSSRYLKGSEVHIHQESLINDALHRGGAAVVRLYYEVAHYVVLTGVKEDKIYMFDPYYVEAELDEADISVVLDHPKEYNRIVPFSCFNRESHELYALGETENREAVLLFNEQTRLTAESTIEFFI